MKQLWGRFLFLAKEYKESAITTIRTTRPEIPPIVKKVVRNTFDARENWILPPKSRPIFEFSETTDLSDWEIVDDSVDGGSSASRIGIRSRPDPDDPSRILHSLVWAGELRPLPTKPFAKLPAYAPRYLRDVEQPAQQPATIDGFCGLISPKKEDYYNLELYKTLALRVETDGRGYFFNVIPDTYASGVDIYQSAIAPEDPPRPLHFLEIDFDQMTQTARGHERYYQAEMPIDRIQGFSFGVRGVGPFYFELATLEIRVEDYELNPELIPIHQGESLIGRLWSMFRPGAPPDEPSAPDMETMEFYKKRAEELKAQTENKRKADEEERQKERELNKQRTKERRGWF